MQQINQQLAQRRADSEAETRRRTAEVISRCPEIGEWMGARLRLLREGLAAMGQDGSDITQLPEKMALANGHIEALLLENGYPKDYLSPTYVCPHCHDQGLVGSPIQRTCTCVKEAYARMAAQSMGIPSRAEEAFEGFDASLFPETLLPQAGVTQRHLTVQNMEVCARFAEQFPHQDRKNLLLMGPSGLGKTFLMHAITKRVLDRGYNALMITAYQFLEIARRSYFAAWHSQEAMEEMEIILQTDLLLVDDLGSEPLMENITISQLFNLLNERERAGRSTVLSTNLTKPNLKSRYTERISSRLQDTRLWKVLLFDGADIRRQPAQRG